MKTNDLTFLSDKYQILESLGTGQFSQVFLARHLKLDRLCAIKVTPHQDGQDSSALKEAKLLQEISHPGIPQIYDIEMDQINSYIVEEYLSGQSLEEFLLHQQFISTDQFYSFCRQLCDIYQYLHTFLGYPLFYQDLKPEHIFVCGATLKLLDFDSIWDSKHPGNNNSKGNTAFSAPEFLAGGVPRVASDIYSLGKLMLYLSDYLKTPISQETQLILNKATNHDPCLRYETVEALESALMGQQTTLKEQHLSFHPKRIAVVGSFSGCGATHLAISLTCHLNQDKYQAIYLERNHGNHLNSLLNYLPGSAEKQGCIYYHTFMGYPFYGPGISLVLPQADYYIYDLGANFDSNDLYGMDQIILVGSPFVWRWRECILRAESLMNYKDILKVVIPGEPRSNLRSLARQMGLTLTLIPLSLDALSPSPKQKKQYAKLLVRQ